ncbi:catalase family protein [Comamonas endophytica]|uniref:Catalase family protein n=1 Tax=Comamonas endophytica TaxID=2949090 RepID=A0ABY6G907_9BURK|nr:MULTISPECIES: catalase family protein [unclassified Acidovorax]MCD2511780.1 catalase family protein [Acidovorax sp. D4N7]UYG51504.1 catalase family protein [Acidovorax sp. 5MLIR]
MNETTAPRQPLAYRPEYESLEDDEAQTTRELMEAMQRIRETVARDEGHAFRSVHAKTHGILHGTLEILPLPDTFAQGLFARPGTHPVTLRMSSTPGDLLDDKVSTPRGVALKILKTEGARLDPADGLQEQDFLMVNGPVFNAPTARKFLKSLKLLAATTDKAPNAKKLLSAALRAIETVVEKAGGESATLKAMGGHPATNPLGETYFTQVPLLMGPYMAKLSLAPAAPQLTALKGAPVDLSQSTHALRDAVSSYFAAQGGTWELRAQLCVDLQQMPIEDASVEWSEGLSPHVPVAILTVPAQASWDNARSPAEDNELSFNPWRGLEAHRPIGSIMRVRRPAYPAGAGFRQRFNAGRSPKAPDPAE